MSEARMHTKIAALAAKGEKYHPVNLQEAMDPQDKSEQGRAAGIGELESLSSKGVYSLMELPEGARCISCMWVFAYKVRADGQIEHYKCRLVAQGFAQRPGVDNNEVWAPTSFPAVLRCLLAYATAHDCGTIQADIRSSFLIGPIEDTIHQFF
jgi:hypothetical protein